MTKTAGVILRLPVTTGWLMR